MVLGLGGAASRIGTSLGSRFAASGGASSIWSSLTSTPLRAGLTGSAVGDLLDVSPLSALGMGGGGGDSGNPLSNLFGGTTIIWAAIAVAALFAFSDLSEDM